MSLSDILGSAVSGLSASQAGIRSVSNNIANVGTPGYARERVSLATGDALGAAMLRGSHRVLRAERQGPPAPGW